MKIDPSLPGSPFSLFCPLPTFLESLTPQKGNLKLKLLYLDEGNGKPLSIESWENFHNAHDGKHKGCTFLQTRNSKGGERTWTDTFQKANNLTEMFVWRNSKSWWWWREEEQGKVVRLPAEYGQFNTADPIFHFPLESTSITFIYPEL